MENVLYILGSLIGITLAIYIYRVCQIIGTRFFLSRKFKEEIFNDSRTISFSPLRIIFFWITKIPYPIPLSLPPSQKDSRVFTPLALLCGPLGLLLFSFLLYILESWLFFRIPVIRELLSITTQISILTALISLLPIPPLDGSRILISLFVPRIEPKVLQYAYIFPACVILLRIIDTLFGLHIMDRVLATILDIVLFVFQMGITS